MLYYNVIVIYIMLIKFWIINFLLKKIKNILILDIVENF